MLVDVHTEVHAPTDLGFDALHLSELLEEAFGLFLVVDEVNDEKRGKLVPDLDAPLGEVEDHPESLHRGLVLRMLACFEVLDRVPDERVPHGAEVLVGGHPAV